MIALLFSYGTLPMLFWVGLLTSYTDYRSGKIYIRHLKRFILLGLLLQGILLLAVFVIGGLRLPPSWLLRYPVNALFALATGFLFWLLRLWAAGDVKLFFVFALLLPFAPFAAAPDLLFPSFNALVNIFLLAFVYIILESVVTGVLALMGRRKRLFYSRPEFSARLFLKQFLRSLLIILLFVVGINQLRDLLVRHLTTLRGLDLAYVYMLLLFCGGLLVRLFSNRWIMLAGSLLLAGIIICRLHDEGDLFLEQLGGFVLIGLGILGGSAGLDHLLARGNDRDIDIGDLQPLMIPSDHLRRLLRKDPDLEHIDRELTLDGLLPEHVVQIQEKCGLEKARIKSPFPLAPFIFAGTLLAVCMPGNLLALFLKLFR